MSATGCDPTLTMMSPARMPERSAGLAASRSSTRTPSTPVAPSAVARSGVSDFPITPSTAASGSTLWAESRRNPGAVVVAGEASDPPTAAATGTATTAAGAPSATGADVDLRPGWHPAVPVAVTDPASEAAFTPAT
jgi:hypothetical protein